MAKRMILMLLAMLVIVGGVFGLKYRQILQAGKAAAANRPPPVTVTAEIAREDTWQPALRTTGSVAAVHGVDLSNELAGTVQAIHFESGAVVEKGTVLVQLNIDSDQAQLRANEAAAELARQTLERARKLRESNVNAQADLDSAQAQSNQAIANVEMVRAAIAKKTIIAPFAGRLGIRRINLGQYLAAGTVIVPLQTVDPVYVDFTLPQQDVRRLTVGQTVEVTTDARPGQRFTGRVNALDSRIDGATRTVRIQATVANPEGLLQPGMFGSVGVMLPQEQKVITVPQTAITYNPYGNAIYVIETKGEASTVRQQFVKLGETRGDQIVTSGQLKLRDGVNVRVDNKVPPSNDAHPTPPNA